jgi:hypothetical protein
MSEYQYYEFQAVDRPLTEQEQREVRSVSTRATVTATRFTNHYEWGDFKGDTAVWMEKYFDVFLYLANWGTHELMLRLPRRALDLKTAQRYCCGEVAAARSHGDFVILELSSLEDEGGDWVDGSGWLSSLIPLRADLMGGDHRALYLAWLLCVQSGELKDDATEPPLPTGLRNLTASLEAFADFLRIDVDLIAVAAARSPEVDTSSSGREIEEWVAALPGAAKTEWLVRLAGGREPRLRSELLRQFRESHPPVLHQGAGALRTVGELREAADKRAEERIRKEAERAAAERARREREAAEARERHLAALGRREAEAWREVDMLVATKQPGKYDQAVKLLCDLKDLGAQRGRAEEIEARLIRLREEHVKKQRFLERLKKAGL